jgi:hypothetical protein
MRSAGGARQRADPLRPQAGEPLHAEHLLRSVTRAIDLAAADHQPTRWHFRLGGADNLAESDGRRWSLSAGASIAPAAGSYRGALAL